MSIQGRAVKHEQRVARQAKMRRLRESGLTLQAIAEQYGLSRNRVRIILLTEYKPIKRPNEQADRNAAIRADRAAGKSLSQLSTKYNISKARIIEIIKAS